MTGIERDLEVLRFIWRYGFVTAWAIGFLFEMKEPRVYRLMARLRDAGLVGYRRLYREYAGGYFLTAQGCRVAGLKVMREPSLEMVTYRHELGVLGIGTPLEKDQRLVVLTEREIRAKQSDGEIWSVGLPGNSASRRWPDLVIRSANKTIAVELELAAKRSARLANIIDGYERCSTYNEVQFVVDQGAVAERICRIGRGWRPGRSRNTAPSSKLRIVAWEKSAEASRVHRAGLALAEPPAPRLFESPTTTKPKEALS